MTRTMKINGVTFEVTVPRTNFPSVERVWSYDGMDLSNYYARPSHIKELIWAQWNNWAYDTFGVKAFGISGANGFQFTISGIYVDPTTKEEYVLYITSAHNRAIKMN